MDPNQTSHLMLVLFVWRCIRVQRVAWFLSLSAAGQIFHASHAPWADILDLWWRFNEGLWSDRHRLHINCSWSPSSGYSSTGCLLSTPSFVFWACQSNAGTFSHSERKLHQYCLGQSLQYCLITPSSTCFREAFKWNCCPSTWVHCRRTISS